MLFRSIPNFVITDDIYSQFKNYLKERNFSYETESQRTLEKLIKIGIPESEQAKIFARFYRSNSVQKQEGVGIGLYLARQIISGEGGYIKVASVPGKGSTFSIFLPK